MPAAAGERLHLGELGPFVGLLGVPDGFIGASDARVEISWTAANSAMGDQSGDELILLDGESHRVTLRAQRRFGERLRLGFALPWVAHSGGFLDSVIDGWHDTFGLSEGIRPALPDNDLRYLYAQGGVERYGLDDATSGIGDLRTSAALRIAGATDADRLSLDVTADVEWPTGEPDRLTGSGGTDVAAGLRLASPGGSRLGWSLGGGLLWPGEVDLPLPSPAGRVLYYDVTLSWAALPALEILGGIRGRSDAFQSEVKMLGREALQLGAAVLWRTTPRHYLRIGVFEDLRTDTAPDFALEVSLVLSPAK